MDPSRRPYSNTTREQRNRLTREQLIDLLRQEMRFRNGQDEETQSFPENPIFDPSNPEHYDDVNRDRIGHKNWCTCNNCTTMPTGIESICCQEIPNVLSKMDNLQCILTHAMIPQLCTNEEWARIFLFLTHGYNAITLADKDRNRRLRKSIYRAFTGWVHGYLGRGERRPIPSCVVNKVRQAFPDPEGQYAGFKQSNEDAAEYMVLDD
ncbi:uncharacterized protein [Hyperolius riggenbachi]|uniref:uncharacterized protein n=1 Tax=Hyperolius riggenbachi TaxID=752182 RepID=UPI0035A26558